VVHARRPRLTAISLARQGASERRGTEGTMDFYSITLALALTAAVAAVGLAGHCWLASVGVLRSIVRISAGRVARRAGAAALGLSFLSAASHLVIGHRPGSASELAPAAFVFEHPALVIAFVLVAGAFLLLWRSRPAAVNVEGSRQDA